jgi:anti-anti-sigma factor
MGMETPAPSIHAVSGVGYLGVGRSLAAVERAADMATSGRLVFDLTEVRLLDSAGIDLPVRAVMRHEVVGNTIVVRRPSGTVRQLLERMRLTKLVPVEAEVAR